MSIETLARIWVAVAVVVQIFWDVLKEHSFIPVDRTVMGLIFFILVSYNFIRWRTARMQDRWEKVDHEPPPRPRVKQPIDPNFDFSDEKKEPPAP